MQAGVAQVDITPAVGTELSGFAARRQPSTGMLDPLWARALWLVDGRRRLLWVHCDLIGLSAESVTRFRTWAASFRKLASHEVILTASHTHSGPPTIRLEECGRHDVRYLDKLHDWLREVTKAAMKQTEPCELVTAEGKLPLAVHRRGPGTRHVDDRVAVVGFRRRDGSLVAALINYAIHPVALGPENRRISGDVLGAASIALSRLRDETPVALFTNGACGNLNPPVVNVPWPQVEDWGGRLAVEVQSLLQFARPARRQDFHCARKEVPLAMDVLTPAQLKTFVAKTRAQAAASGFGEKLERAVRQWSRDRMEELDRPNPASRRNVELHSVRLGDLTFLGVNAEVFSEFSSRVAAEAGVAGLYTVGYANGDLGYLAPRAAYEEGGYEVDLAHVFYGGWRFAPGAFEELATQAAALLKTAGPKVSPRKRVRTVPTGS